jgi:predicted S18 family serine protease
MCPLRTSLARFLLVACVAVLALNGCALNPPLQEMSNARQALQAAEEAQAQVYAPQPYAQAQRHLRKASDYLEAGDYTQARTHAMEAKVAATKARQQALSERRDGTN